MLRLQHADSVPDSGALYAEGKSISSDLKLFTESYTSTLFEVSPEQATRGTWSLYAAAVPDLMAQQDVALEIPTDITDGEPIRFEFLNACQLIGWSSSSGD